MSKQHTRDVNALTALLRTHDLGIDARKKLTHAQIETIAAWREHSRDDLAQAAAREEARILAREIRDIDERTTANDKELAALVEATPARALLPMTGVGPFTAAQCYVSWSHEGRIRSEASFAALAGVNPIPASSGNTQRYRLNRFGDRQLNRALHGIAINRATHDPETVAYMARRTDEGKSKKETRRCLKRYLARKIYRLLNTATKTLTDPQPTTA
jgi:transposase